MFIVISYYYYLDEFFYFNSLCLISHDVVQMLLVPIVYEKFVVNLVVKGC